ncbi:nitrous oxide reductase maturation protein NosD [Myroides odoratimimus]|uniref:nitrous oxide reductase family maturation protein NosD n=1 Tax=Myroides TaxID=76831 RepID=UPI0003530D42|nr:MULTISPECIES: nitrous oxide reductase family maturation protein NosD [Myroides]AJA70346.1 nitrous oxide reductase family maturation protein NosD [Myroides sp. A21]EPH13048.1 nitrous oxidase accessory protein [Myroides odoratimimus CCUG 12700]MDM1328060.1 nitrous oxide reductase family maturation protein NosD [Myroides odoratimimus]MDM1401529.1 nitrous oxide reductase family maturation protein NosD [Myroides odoratimimus]MDM1457245.1 nitrous oxide reductase family maturation protein NosD [My
MNLIFKNFLFLLLLTQGFCGVAKTITVSRNSTITSIKKAIELAEDNDVINVESDTYKETDILINKPLTIKGNNATIDGDNKGEIFIVKANDVTIQDFKIINVGTSYIKDYAAIRVRESQNFVIKNNIIEDLFFGIYLEKSKNGKVLNNKIYGKAKSEFNSGNGIQLWYSNYIEIKNNYVEKVRDGIYLEFSSYCTIDNNISKQNVRYGLHFMFSNNDTVSNCSFTKNGAGVAIMFSKFMKMYHNTFSDNWGSAAYGVLLKEVNDTSISYNLFKNNTTAINIEGSNRVEYLHNDFVNNGWAINSKGANYQNKVNNNNFLNNSFDLLYQGQLNQNSFEGNYWSNYSGYDLDKDGIGDVPYRPIRLFSYVVNKTPESIIFLRSLFVDIIDFSEKVAPVFTPDNLIDSKPFIKQIKHDSNK